MELLGHLSETENGMKTDVTRKISMLLRNHSKQLSCRGRKYVLKLAALVEDSSLCS